MARKIHDLVIFSNLQLSSETFESGITWIGEFDSIIVRTNPISSFPQHFKPLLFITFTKDTLMLQKYPLHSNGWKSSAKIYRIVPPCFIGRRIVPIMNMHGLVLWLAFWKLFQLLVLPYFLPPTQLRPHCLQATLKNLVDLFAQG